MIKFGLSYGLATLLLTLTLHSPLALAANKTEKPKEKLNNIHQRIESLTKELGKTKEAHADAADALKDSEKAISENSS